MVRRILFLEGVIGAGKSSALAYLQSCLPQAVVLYEPVARWQNISNNNLLLDFYQDKEKYAFCFQTTAFLTRMQELIQVMEQHPQATLFICDRSVFSDREIFVEHLHANGFLNDLERAVYHQLWDFWCGLMKPYFANTQVDFILLQCSPDKALEHLKTRGRVEEAGVPLAVLHDLSQRHQQLYQSEHGRKKLSKLVTQIFSTMGQISYISNDKSLNDLYYSLAGRVPSSPEIERFLF